jgi:hypothetical protein
MEMFLMAAAMSLLGVAVCAVLFAAAARDDRGVATEPVRQAAHDRQRFFAAAPAAPPRAEPTAKEGTEPELVPVEALLLRIEQHIRLEQAAAEAFLHRPTDEALHSRTTSRLVN